MEGWPAKGISAKRSEKPLIRPTAANLIHGDREDAGIVCALPEVIFANLSGCRKMCSRDLIRPIHTIRTCARLLHTGIDRERKAAADRRDTQQLPSGSHFSIDRL